MKVKKKEILISKFVKERIIRKKSGKRCQFLKKLIPKIQVILNVKVQIFSFTK
jgi:hypothetical protein